MPTWIRNRWPSVGGASLAVMVGLVMAINTQGRPAILVGFGGMVMAGACLRIGRAASGLARTPLAAEDRFLIGLAALGYVLSAPAHLLGISVLAGAVAFLLGSLAPARAANEPEEPDPVAILLCFGAAAGFALIWSLESSQRLSQLAHDGIFRLWTDFFIHAGAIADFGDLRALGRQGVGLADVPQDLYHFTSYSVPALAVRLTRLTPLESIGAVWLPLGVTATALGVLALGRELAGRVGGALSLLLLAAVPDTASYGMKQGFLSFHWMLETAPGSLYALPCACMSLVLLVRWTRLGGWRLLAASATLLAAVFLIRAHIFIWLVGPWAAVCVAAAPRLTAQQKGAVIGLGFVAAAAGMLFVARAALQQMGFVAYSAAFIQPLHTFNPPTANDGLYPELISSFGRGGALPFGVALALVEMGGVPLVTFLVGAVIAARGRRFEVSDLFPFALLAWAGALMLWAPIPFHGDAGELRQRGFLLVVVALLSWNARWVCLLWPRPIPAVRAAVAACAALAVTQSFVTEWKAPRMNWGKSMVSWPVSSDIQAAAAWLRTHSGHGTAFTVSQPDPKADLIDDATILSGLSGDAAWLSRPAIHAKVGGRRAFAAEHRLHVLDAVAEAPTRQAAMALLKPFRVAFYIVNTPAGPAWDPGRTGAVFKAGAMAIYETGGP
ncbi:MAG: hypothetical protein JO303_01975 [Caulobacteraceae bacterium]|nr:hypothetical protein [Caulobacteraceae bacterium]